MTRWVDSTSYSRKDEKRIPSSYSLMLGREPSGKQTARIVVHRIVGVPGEWYLTCRELDINGHKLRESDIEKAKEKAIAYLREIFAERICSYVAARVELGKIKNELREE